MKIRNKKTGAIYSIEDIDLGNNKDGIWLGLTRYTSLAELCKDWEDLEEDKRYWYIDSDGEVMSKELAWFTQYQDDVGNRFETKEDAEKAVEKLKAWKRLKDYYINFRLDFVKNTINFTYRIDGTLHSAINEERIIFEDMKTIFGGNDESSN